MTGLKILASAIGEIAVIASRDDIREALHVFLGVDRYPDEVRDAIKLHGGLPDDYRNEVGNAMERSLARLRAAMAPDDEPTEDAE